MRPAEKVDDRRNERDLQDGREEGPDRDDRPEHPLVIAEPAAETSTADQIHDAGLGTSQALKDGCVQPRQLEILA